MQMYHDHPQFCMLLGCMDDDPLPTPPALMNEPTPAAGSGSDTSAQLPGSKQETGEQLYDRQAGGCSSPNAGSSTRSGTSSRAPHSPWLSPAVMAACGEVALLSPSPSTHDQALQLVHAAMRGSAAFALTPTSSGDALAASAEAQADAVGTPTQVRPLVPVGAGPGAIGGGPGKGLLSSPGVRQVPTYYQLLR
jgi:hypothetical protein